MRCEITVLAKLMETWQAWCKSQGFELADADEILYAHGETLTQWQHEWIGAFVTLWNWTEGGAK